MDAHERAVDYYELSPGRFPFRVWRNGLRDGTVKQAVDARIARLRTGNFGKFEPVGDGVLETKIDLGPGFRIYFGVDRQRIILLIGGDKSTQSKDIGLAKSYWNAYTEGSAVREG